MTEQVGKRAVGSMLALAGILVVGLFLQPATAHVGTPKHLWTTHLRPLADARYLQNSNVYVSTEFTLLAGANLTVDRLCPAGTQAVGGGVDFVSGAAADVRVTSNAPLVASDNLVAANTGKNPRSNGWRVKMHNNNGAGAYTGVVGAICSR
jgi:hypothetical protein